ncbi:MAG: ABC transporter permease, partial [Planctomycetota bacterium]
RIDKEPAAKVATKFLQTAVDEQIVDPEKTETAFWRFVRNTGEHILLVAISLALAIAVAIPLGIIAYKLPRFGEVILSIVGVIQTIPSLALMVFLITLAGMDIGAKPAIVALFLYSLLPIVRGTHTGLSNLAPSIQESALALGLGSFARLRLIELPIASPSILAGIKTAAVINVGTATIGALIGANGYGQPILTGIRLDDMGLVLQGAIPAAGLALLVQWGFGWAEQFVVPRGLKAGPSSD